MLKSQTNKPLLIALLLRLLVVHAPLAAFLMITNLDFSRQVQPQKKQQQPVFVSLNQPQPHRTVDIARPKVQKKPKKASAQSLYDSSVTQETTARDSRRPGSNKPKTAGIKANPHTPAAQTPPPQQTPTASEQKPAPTSNPLKPQTDFSLPAKPKDQLSLKDELKSLKLEHQSQENEKFQKTFQNSAPMAMPNFKPQVGGSGDDYVPEYKVGSRTFLNTLANPNVSYYVELRRRFRTAFNPAPVLRPIYSRIAGRGSVSVIIGVSVDSAGRLVEIVMIRSSGIPAYDNEARRTVSVSAPFSAPPAAQLDKDGRMNMAWTFTVYL